MGGRTCENKQSWSVNFPLSFSSVKRTQVYISPSLPFCRCYYMLIIVRASQTFLSINSGGSYFSFFHISWFKMKPSSETAHCRKKYNSGLKCGGCWAVTVISSGFWSCSALHISVVRALGWDSGAEVSAVTAARWGTGWSWGRVGWGGSAAVV